MCRWDITGKKTMKKLLIILTVTILSGLLFTAFMSTHKISQIESNSNEFTIDRTHSVYTVSVCKITSTGTSGTITNHSFKGKYDSDDDYITIYNKDGEKVASGTPSYNKNRQGARGKYDYCLRDTYYFNL